MPGKKPPKFLTRDVRVSAWIPAKPEQVYEAFTVPHKLCNWWTAQAESEPRNLGRIHLVWGSSKRGSRAQPRRNPQLLASEGRGVFVDLEPTRKISWIWDAKTFPNGTPPLTSIFLEALNNGCRVTVVHAGFPSTPKGSGQFKKALQFWSQSLERLEKYFKSTALKHWPLLAHESLGR